MKLVSWPSLAMLLVLPGCAVRDDAYPSLMMRPVERMALDAPALPTVPVKPVADPALDRRLSDVAGQLRAAANAFAIAEARARPQVASAAGATAGSTAWMDAQIALGQLDEARAQTSTLVSTLTGLAGERATALMPAYPALTSLIQNAQAQAEAQATSIARLQTTLQPG